MLMTKKMNQLILVLVPPMESLDVENFRGKIDKKKRGYNFMSNYIIYT